MMALYPNVLVAARRAFAAPRASQRSPLAVSPGRDHEALTADERIAQDGMVQQMAVALCSTPSVMTFRALWEEDALITREAMLWWAGRFQRPGRAPPRAWGMAVVQKWTGRRILALPAHSDAQWAGVLGVDRRTVGAWRRELRDSLDVARRDGLIIMQRELRQRGLIPEES